MNRLHYNKYLPNQAPFFILCIINYTRYCGQILVRDLYRSSIDWGVNYNICAKLSFSETIIVLGEQGLTEAYFEIGLPIFITLIWLPPNLILIRIKSSKLKFRVFDHITNLITRKQQNENKCNVKI